MSAGFTQLTDAQLNEMNLDDLQAYSRVVSTTIGLEYSSIVSDQVIQVQYEYMILTSQSTINGIGYEIIQNDNAIIAGNIRYNQLNDENITLDSTIVSYEKSMAEQDKIISDSDTMISSLILESAKIDRELIQSDKEFISSAVSYSSLYMTFMAKDLLYQNCMNEISTTSSLLDASILEEIASFRNLEESTATVTLRRRELSTLYLEGDQIQSSLSQYIIDETLATAALTSTNAGIIALSSLYDTAIINQQYYQLLSTQGSIIDTYNTAESTLTNATMLSLADPTNTVLAAAKTMAKTRVDKTSIEKIAVAKRVTTKRTLVAGADVDTYDVTLAAAQVAVELEVQNVSTFQGYANIANNQITYYSSIFEQAGRDIQSSMAAVLSYSSLYISSIAGSNVLMKLVSEDMSSIAGQQAEADAITLIIKSLTGQYDSSVSSYSGWINYSTLMKQEVETSERDLASFSTLYESTNTGILQLYKDLPYLQSSIYGNDVVINTLSSILESEGINMLGYQTLITNSFNSEEQATFQYRETYVRLKRVDAQTYYEACILQQVQNTSTQNATLKTQAGAATFTPIAITLNTATINLAYANLTTITSFLTSFNNIYSNYEIQKVNLQGVSTSIGDQRTTYSTLITHSNISKVNPTNLSAQQNFFNTQKSFIEKQNTTTQSFNNVNLTQGQINTAKNSFLTTYKAVFISTDIINNESTISSFLIKGFNSAVL